MKRVLAVVAIAIVSAGVIFSAGAASASYRDRFLSFRYPGSWRIYHWPIPSHETTFLVWLSNVHLRDPCTLRTAAAFRCGDPIGRLPAGAVLVRWTRTVLPGAAAMSRPLSTLRPGRCGDIGADETLSAAFPGGYSLEACVRRPGVTGAERQVRAMVSSLRVLVPGP